MEQHARDSHQFYGAFFDTLAAALQPLSPFGSYETRHLLNALNGLLILYFAARIAKELGGWPAALLCLLFLGLSPRFMAHAMNNPKDIPFALGYTAAVYFLLMIAKELPNIRWQRWLALMLAIAYAISIRIGGVLLFFYLFMLIGGYLAFPFGTMASRWRDAIQRRLYLGLIFCVLGAYLLGIAFWPYAHQDPIGHPLKALQAFSNFSQLLAYELFAGERFFVGEPPAHYLFTWMAISLPLYFFLGLAGLAYTGWAKRKAFPSPKVRAYLLLLFVMLFPVVFLVVNGSALYSGWRHVLFVHPLLAVLSAQGVVAIYRHLSNRPYAQWALATFCAILLALPLRWMWANHPHQLAYFNELIGGTAGAYSNYETDYWGVSMRKGVEKLGELLPNHQDSLTVATNFEPETAIYFAKKAGLPLRFTWVRETERYRHRWDYALFGSRTYSPQALQAIYPPASTVATISADGAPLLAIVERGESFLPQAYDFQEKGQLSEAIAQSMEAMKADPAQTVEAMRLAAVILIVSRQADKAIPLLQNALEIDPADYVAQTILGLAYREAGEAETAVGLFLAAIDIRKNYVNAYLQLGETFQQLGEDQRAVTVYKRGIQFTQSPALYLSLGKILLQSGSPLAKDALLQALKGKLENDEAQQLLNQIKRQ